MFRLRSTIRDYNSAVQQLTLLLKEGWEVECLYDRETVVCKCITEFCFYLNCAFICCNTFVRLLITSLFSNLKTFLSISARCVSRSMSLAIPSRV
jgi:hypothetical protein